MGLIFKAWSGFMCLGLAVTLLPACESPSAQKPSRKETSQSPASPVEKGSGQDEAKRNGTASDSTAAGGNTANNSKPPEEQVTPAPSSQTTDGYTCLEAPQAFDCDTEELIFLATNKARVEAGLQAFRLDVKLGWLARDWSQQMAAANRLSHDGFPSARNQRYQSKFGVAISVPMEICAGGGGVMPRDERTIAGSMMQAWYSSQAHMDQMLNPNFKSVGIGVAPDSSGRWYATQIFGF